MIRPRKDDDEIRRMGMYLMENYHMLIDSHAIDCPYYFDNKELDDFVSHIWGSYAAILPGTKTRLVDDYVKKRVRDPVIAAKIRRTDQILIDTFKVLHADRNRGRFLLRSETNGTEYRAVSGMMVAGIITKGGTYNLMIHLWEEDGSYNIGAVLPTKPERHGRTF